MPAEATLPDLLRQSQEALVQEAVQAVDRSHLPGYARSGAAATEERLRELLAVLVHCIETRAIRPAAEHAERIARDRHQAGFNLREVQTAINALEEVVWKRVLDGLPPPAQAEALGLVSTVLGMTKDRLGQTFVALAGQTAAPSLDLRRLFAGTDGV